ncbi:hypothetical protein BZA05DRAFT_421131 [Tricharina praecox]|uniref:uncharacterized protein n=1 Tax=Tricharina praecox TaxID=43433 RepID=UPI00222066B7|nr:uncharacterized protein BZA05DRAFT_421131 [Tricharina praecox]KAI5846198.1 hypothetical protein BZA05DRAFT_421131 [Tricharina praecox]
MPGLDGAVARRCCTLHLVCSPTKIVLSTIILTLTVCLSVGMLKPLAAHNSSQSPPLRKRLHKLFLKIFPPSSFCWFSCPTFPLIHPSVFCQGEYSELELNCSTSFGSGRRGGWRGKPTRGNCDGLFPGPWSKFDLNR